MFNKKFMWMAVFLVGLIAMTAVSANQLDATDELAIDESSFEIMVCDEEIIQENAKTDTDLENDMLCGADDDEPSLIEAKLEVISTPTNPGDNTVLFKLTKAEDNSPLANVSLGIKSPYDHYMDGIITDSNGFATYYHALNAGTYSLIVGLGDSNGFGSTSETLHCDVKFFDITIKEPTDDSLNEIVVNGNSFADIQKAVFSVKNGGVVKLSGNYKGTGKEIRINRNITIMGVGNTVLDGDCLDLIFNIVSGGVSIYNLTFINGYTDMDDFKDWRKASAGAIQATGDNILIKNCKFISNQGFLCGAIELKGNYSVIEDCSFTANTANLKNGMSFTEYVYESDGRRKDIVYSFVNTAGAFRFQGNNCLVSNCEFINNEGYVDFIFEGNNNIIKENKLDLFASDITKYVGGSEKYTVTLKDNGVAVANANVKITLNGKDFTVKTNSKGQASVDLDLGVGSYDVICVYDNARIASKVNVKSTIAASDVTGNYSNSKVTATFLDSAGKALASKQVTFKVGDKSYSATTNSNGVATVNIPLSVGTYSVTAINPTNNEKKQFKLTISKSLASTAVSVSQNANGVTLTAALIPSTATGNVTFLINGEETYYAVVKNGKASITIPDLAPGTYRVAAIYGGDSNLGFYIGESISFKVDEAYPILTANDLTKTYGNTNKFVVNLVDNKGNAIVNANVNVDINGEITPITTDSNGQATMPISLKPATYTAKVTYGDLQTDAKIVVKKATPKMTASAKSFKKSDKTKKYIVTLKNNKNAVIKNAKVTLKVNGKTYTTKVNTKGQAIFKLTKLTKKGTFTATVKYAGSNYYNAKTVKPKITVK